MRKVRTGTVVRTRTEKTAVVEAVWKQRHRLYRKQRRRVARFQVHDPLSQCQLGDTVRIQEVRPISKTKRWRLLEIMHRRQVAEVRPIELESDAELTDAAEPDDTNSDDLDLDELEDFEDDDRIDGLEPDDEEDEQ
jgi:small subunit ribosomal protein S17